MTNTKKTESFENWGIHWFRRDLRIAGNESLRENWRRSDGRVLALFCFDSKFLSRDDFSYNRFGFFLATLKALKEEFRQWGGDLLVVDSLPEQAFETLFLYLEQNKISAPKNVSWNRDYEPFARNRDARIEALLTARGISPIHNRDHLFFEPEEILKPDGGHYSVYSPFSRSWANLFASDVGKLRLSQQEISKKYYSNKSPTKIFSENWQALLSRSDSLLQDKLDDFIQRNRKNQTIEIPQAGAQVAYSRLLSFKSEVDSYSKLRDLPSENGTSRLSMYLKNGSLTVSQILAELWPAKNSDFNLKDENGLVKYTKELIWREFYYSILFHRPKVETESFNPKYLNLQWSEDRNLFDRWKEGTTGFPIVDAGMRQLRTTGWMHNRVRMIVASFLTKDLLINWQWGENYFMKELLDGDLACNNGGWQWAASTGCDPQPYFRVFNPWLQSQKFDPTGAYIKRFVPELRTAPPEFLHRADLDRSKWKYPKPIVDHNIQRMKAISLYKN